MRQLFQKQLPLCGPTIPHRHARELEAMDRVPKENPRIAEAVLQELQGKLEYPERGRPGLTAEQVLRAAVIKQMNGFSYAALHFHLLDSISYRWFCGFGSLEQVPGKSALARNIKRISPAGLILDWVVEEGNPVDTTLLVRMLERQEALYGRVPEQAALDGGFASQENLRQAKAMGVRDVVFAKKVGLDVLEMARSTWVCQRLRNFRAGIEGIISFLKRIFGLKRCTWRGAASFRRYVGASIFSANLLLLARHLIA